MRSKVKLLAAVVAVVTVAVGVGYFFSDSESFKGSAEGAMKLMTKKSTTTPSLDGYTSNNQKAPTSQTTPPPPDFCVNIDGSQSAVPADEVRDAAGNCLKPEELMAQYPTNIEVQPARSRSNSGPYNYRENISVKNSANQLVDLHAGYSLTMLDSNQRIVAMTGIGKNIMRDAQGQNPVYPIIKDSTGRYSVNFVHPSEVVISGNYRIELTDNVQGRVLKSVTVDPANMRVVAP